MTNKKLHNTAAFPAVVGSTLTNTAAMRRPNGESRKGGTALTRKLLTFVAVCVAALVFGVMAFAAATLNKCGPAAHNAAQWRAHAMQNGTWDHVLGVVRKNGNMYAYHPIDGDSVRGWYNRQVIVAPAAHKMTIPNTGCNGNGGVENIDDKSVARLWPLVGALPNGLTTKDVRTSRTAWFNHMRKIMIAYIGQSTCINGTSRAVLRQVIVFVHKAHGKKPAPKKKPVVVTPKPKVTPVSPACLTLTGVPIYAPLPSGVSVVNGVCTVTQTTTITTQGCKESQTVTHDSNGNIICLENSNTNTNNNIITTPVTVVVTLTPPVVTPPAVVDVCPNLAGAQDHVPDGLIKDAVGNCVSPPATYTAKCVPTGVSGLTLSFAAQGTASNAAAPVIASWGFSDGATVVGPLNVSRTFASYATTYSVTSLKIQFSDGHVETASSLCSGTTGPAPQVTRSITCLTNHDVSSGGLIDLEVKVVNSDGSQPTLSPADITIWTDEGQMLVGTTHTYTDSSGTYWVQRWQAPISTIEHAVQWHATATGVAQPCTGSNMIRVGW